jgi:hypothetical protein
VITAVQRETAALQRPDPRQQASRLCRAYRAGGSRCAENRPAPSPKAPQSGSRLSTGPAQPGQVVTPRGGLSSFPTRRLTGVRNSKCAPQRGPSYPATIRYHVPEPGTRLRLGAGRGDPRRLPQNVAQRSNGS